MTLGLSVKTAGQPDRANLLPAGRDAVRDPSGHDQMSARVVVAERQTETIAKTRGQSAACREPKLLIDDELARPERS